MYEYVACTGAAGFIGHHLTRYLLNQGYRVLGIDNFSTGRSENVESLRQYANFSFIQKDINDLTQEELKGVEGIFHTAALPRVQISIDKPEETNYANITGTLHLLEMARQAGVRKIVYSASSSAYGDQKESPLHENLLPNPKSPYAVQKLVGEYYGKIYSELFNLHFVALRYFNVYGPGQQDDSPYTGVITIFKKAFKENKSILIYGDGEQRRDFTYVDDVVLANIMAMESDKQGIFNVGSGHNYSINEIAKMIGCKDIAYTTARDGDPRETLANINKIKQLGWSPQYNLKETINTF